MINFLGLLIIAVGSFLSITPEARVDFRNNQTLALFTDKPNPELYWKALVQIARGDKKGARESVAALQSGRVLSVSSSDSPLHDIDVFFDQLFLDSVMTDPQSLSALGLFESIGIKEHNAFLTISEEDNLEKIERAQERLVQLRQYPVETLSAEQVISSKIFAWKLQHKINGKPFRFHTYHINQMTGTLSGLTATFMQHHRLETQEDVENYIARLGKIPQKMQRVIGRLEKQKKLGIVPPRFALEKSIKKIQKTIPSMIESQLFYNRLARYLETSNIIDKHTLLEQAKTVMKVAVYPAYEMLKDYLTELLNDTQRNDGVWALPDGDAYYDFMLASHTTTHLTAQEIHELGLREVERIHNEMRSILASEGILDPTKNVGALVQELAQDKRFYFPNTDEGRAQCLKRYEAILERSRKELGHLFDLRPQAGVQIERVPLHEEEGAAQAFYRLPSLDGYRPGIFFANLRNMNELPTYGMETLTIHEAEPGHHFQLALQFDMPVPIERKRGLYTAYVEGWALYTEKLAYEHNFYSSSWSKLGHLQDELLRAARLVIDTGIHYKRWTREQAIEYMEEVTGYHHDSVVTEVERYFVMPGQACAYKIGQLKILELRQRAHDTLKNNFSLQEFHTVVLGLGAAPLTVLEEVVNGYIQKKLEAIRND